MKKQQIVKLLEAIAPHNLAEDWDCVGSLVETENEDLNRVMLALTVTGDVFKQARASGCDMIISHHPLFFVPIEYRDIDIFCAHTNLDKAEFSTTDRLIEALGLPMGSSFGDFVKVVELEKPISVNKFGKLLKTISDNVRVVNNFDVKEIKKIGFCAGSGSEFIDDSFDAFVTGDLKYHTVLECGTVLFDVGHYESEKPSLSIFEKALKGEVDIIFARERSPFNSL